MIDTPNWLESRKRSVDNIQRIYSIIMGLSVIEVIRNFIFHSQKQESSAYLFFTTFKPSSMQLNIWMNMIVIMSTIIAYYHCTNRYLDSAYVTGRRSSLRFALLLDFIFLLIESILLYSMAFLINNSSAVYKLFAVLLCVEVVWIVTTIFTTRNKMRNIEIKIFLDIISAIIVYLLYLSINKYDIWRNPDTPTILFATCAVVRSIMDLYLLRDFYCPKDMLDLKLGHP